MFARPALRYRWVPGFVGRFAMGCGWSSSPNYTILAFSLIQLSRALWRGGDLTLAAEHARNALRLQQATTSPLSTAHAVQLLAWIAATVGESERAAVLLGATNQVWRTFGIGNLLDAPLYRPQHENCEVRARGALGEVRFDACFRHGCELSIDEIVSFAAGTTTEPAQNWTASAPIRPSTVLSRRELEVAALVAEGLTNRGIAARLVISQRTAESHVEHILTKLGFRSRAQIAGWFTTAVTRR